MRRELRLRSARARRPNHEWRCRRRRQRKTMPRKARRGCLPGDEQSSGCLQSSPPALRFCFCACHKNSKSTPCCFLGGGIAPPAPAPAGPRTRAPLGLGPDHAGPTAGMPGAPRAPWDGGPMDMARHTGDGGDMARHTGEGGEGYRVKPGWKNCWGPRHLGTLGCSDLSFWTLLH